MDADCLETSDEFEHHARLKRLESEVVGVRDRYSNMQPTSEPAIDKYLFGKRLDVCLQYFFDDGGTELLCIQGGVILVSYGTNIPNKQGLQACYKASEVFMILWDKNNERNEAVIELPQRLLRSKWYPMATHSRINKK